MQYKVHASGVMASESISPSDFNWSSNPGFGQNLRPGRCCVVSQVVNRDKLQRAGEDNLFVRLLYAKDRAQKPRNQDEQEKLGKQVMTDSVSHQ